MKEEVSLLRGYNFKSLPQIKDKRLVWFDDDQNSIRLFVNGQITELGDEENSEEGNRIAFYLQSDTLVYSALPILKRMKQNSFEIFTPRYHDENASSTLTQLGYKFKVYRKRELKNINTVVVFNDWALHSKCFVLDARSLKIPSICIQESMVDFNSLNRMQLTDSVFLQGAFYIRKVSQKLVFVTGNPRYEKYILSAENKKNENRVMINFNFTYNIMSQHKFKWLDDIITVLEKNNLDYFISQHPRDKTDLSKYKHVIPSGASTISDQFKDVSLLISRFSSLIHEAAIHNIPSIFYNPYNSDLVTNLMIDHSVVTEIKDSKNLENIINERIKNSNEINFKGYIALNCINLNNKSALPSEKIARILNSLRLKSSSLSWSKYIWYKAKDQYLFYKNTFLKKVS